MTSRFGPREGWAAIVLFVAMLLSVAWSIQAAEWTEGLSILQTMVLTGGLAGVVFAKSRTPTRLAHALSLLAGTSWAAYLTSRNLSHASSMTVERAIIELAHEFEKWLNVLFTGGTTAGNYIFVLLLASLMWLLGYISAWAIFRWQRVWWAVILCGVSLLFNVTYAPNTMTGYLITFLISALLLVARTHLAQREQEWDGARVTYDSELSYGFLRSGLVITVVAILLAWAAPSALASRPLQKVWDRVGEPWRRIQDQSSRIFHNLNYQNEPAFVTFGLSTRFGGPVELSDEPVMDVKSMYGRYWRVMVFHEYTGTGWNNTDQDTLQLEEGSNDLTVPDLGLRLNITQTFIMNVGIGGDGVVAAAAQPVRVLNPMRARVSNLPLVDDAGQSMTAESPNRTAPGDASVLYTRLPIAPGDSYQVVSSVTLADEGSLRQAGTQYPTWIAPRYLQLPDSLPERVRDLAQEIAGEQATPFDKAVAVESYLRTIPYNQRIDGPTAEQDGVDYFLFDEKQGYCDYYASAMVTMLRSLGVPARYVQGYTPGEYDNGLYHVREVNSHAWPEVYFPGYGWIEFEPTAAEPVIVRPRSQDNNAALARPTPELDEGERLGINDGLFDRPPDAIGPTPVPETFLQKVGRWGGVVLAVLAAIVLLVALVLLRRRRLMEGLSLSERVYADLVTWVRMLFGLNPLEHQTPFEYATAVGQAMRADHPAVEQVAGYYVQERFGGRPVPETEIKQAWSEAWPAIWRQWVDQRLEGVRGLWHRLGLSKDELEEPPA